VFLGDPQKERACAPLQIQRYRSKVFGRFSIASTLKSKCRRSVINVGRALQLQHFHKRNLHANARMGAREIRR